MSTDTGKFDNSLINKLIPVTLNGIRESFPGRPAMLSYFSGIPAEEYPMLSKKAEPFLGESSAVPALSYIAFCDPRPVVGYGDSRRTLYGTDDPLLGATRPSFEFSGSTICVHSRTFNCFTLPLSGNYTVNDILESDDGYIQISLFILVTRDGHSVIFDLSDGKMYTEKYVDVSVKPLDSISSSLESVLYGPRPDLTAILSATTKSADSGSTTSSLTPSTDKKTASTSKTSVTTTGKTAPSAHKASTSSSAKTAKKSTTSGPSTTKTVKPVSVATKSGSAYTASTTSKTTSSRSVYGRSFTYFKSELVNAASVLRSLTAILITLCVVSLALELFALANWFDEITDADYGTITFTAFVVGAVLLEGLTMLVYIKSFKNVKRKFPRFYKFKERSANPRFPVRCSCRIPMRVNCFFIYLLLHIGTRAAYLLCSDMVFESLCSALKFGL